MGTKTYTLEEGKKVEQAVANRTFKGLLQCIRCHRWFGPYRTKMWLKPASECGVAEYRSDEFAFLCEHCLNGFVAIALD